MTSYTDEETGITLTVYSTLYVDWGLVIDGPQEQLYCNPCCLSRESYGFHDDDDDDQPLDEGVPWTDAEWKTALRDEFDDLVDAFVGWESIPQPA